MVADRWLEHASANHLQSVALVGLLVGVAGTAAWLVLGATGAMVAVGVTSAALLADPAANARLTLRLLGARPVLPAESPELWRILASLSRRAGLAATPRPHLIRSRAPNAFAMGHRGRSAIGLTEGLLLRLDRRELTAVLAHEIAHIANDDLRVLNLAGLAARMTQVLSLVGQGLLVVALLTMGLGGNWQIDWLALALLVVSPYLAVLLERGLSRVREFDADLKAAALTGDPCGLAQALARIESMSRPWWQRWWAPPALPESGWLRSHPATRARIDRLLALAPHMAA